MESFKYCMEIQSNELNSASEQLPDCIFNPNWENSMDQNDPFESAMSSIVSSPAASNSTAIPGGAGGDSLMIRELIGRLGSICNSGEISPQSYICSNNNTSNSTNNSCYGTPLNSPPKLNLSMVDHQMRMNLQIPGNHLQTPPSLVPFSGDPGFAERAAKFSCFGSRNLGGLNGQFGLNEAELAYRSMPRVESKLNIASSNQPAKVAGSQMGVQNGNSVSEKKNNRPSTPENGEFGDSREGSSVSEQIPGGELSGKTETEGNNRKRKSIPRGKAKETPSSSVKEAKTAAENDESNAKRSKKDTASGNEKDASKSKAEPEGNQKKTKENSKPPEPPKDYIHVRARRGQATDSHSLAERVRREKISERMKFLQDLVPGCNKVTGKAVMLDEIINYVQSLQRQVEFLSMKLATVNPRMDLNMEALLSKDIFQSRGSLPNALYPLESSLPSFSFGYHNQQLPSSLHNNISTASETQFPVNPLNAAALHRNPSIQLPAINGYAEASPQVPSFFEDDLQSVVQMGFGQIQQQNFPGSTGSAQMKVEL